MPAVFEFDTVIFMALAYIRGLHQIEILTVVPTCFLCNRLPVASPASPSI